MPSQRIIEFVRSRGMPISMERNAAFSFVWNGRDLALYSFAPAEDGFPSQIKIMEDWELLHELAHWLVADEEERAMFEYGCDPVMTEYIASGFNDYGTPVSHGVLEPEEQDRREEKAYFLGILLCYQLGVSFPKENHPINSTYAKRDLSHTA